MMPFNSAAVACKKSLDWQGALGVLSEMRRDAVLPDVVLYNTVMACCGKSHRWRHTLALLQQMDDCMLQPSVVSCSTAIAACRNHHTEALQIFDGMEYHAVQPNLVCYSAATSACEKGHDWAKALQLLHRMADEHWTPDVIHFNSVISVLEKSKLWSFALWVLCMMTDKKVTPDGITYNAAISACGSHWQHGLALLQALRLRGLEPDAVTFSAAISAVEKGRTWQSGMSLFAEMPFRAIARNTIVFTAAMTSEWRQSLLLLKEMTRQSLQPTEVTFGALAKTAAEDSNWLVVLELLNEMERVEVKANIIHYNSLLKALDHNWEAAAALLQDLPQRKVEADAVSYWTTMDVLLAAGCWRKTLQLLRKMIQKDLAGYVTTVDEVYDHSEQAGGVMDCAKHSMLVLLLQHLTNQCRPFTYLDTHSGRGLYDLESATAREYRNFQSGIHAVQRNKKKRAVPTPSAMAQYLSQMNVFNDQSASSRFYLGSPALACRFLRPCDRAIFFEASKEVYRALQQSLTRLNVKDGVRTLCTNSYLWLQDVAADGLRGPGLVLMDPPYEPYNEYLTWNLYSIRRLQEVWPESCIAMWYPCTDPQQRHGIKLRLEDLKQQLDCRMLIAELVPLELGKTRAATTGSGVAVINTDLELSEVENLFRYLQEVLEAPSGMEVSCFEL